MGKKHIAVIIICLVIVFVGCYTVTKSMLENMPQPQPKNRVIDNIGR